MNCSYNNMTKLPDQVLPRTELLIMTGNNLGNLHSIPDNIPEINELDLNRSNIKTISDKGLKTLLMKTKKLYLTNNKLQQFPRLAEKKKILTEFWLSENPFECNCDMMWMRDWLQNATNVMDKDQIKCREGRYQGKQNQDCVFVHQFIFVSRLPMSLLL